MEPLSNLPSSLDHGDCRSTVAVSKQNVTILDAPCPYFSDPFDRCIRIRNELFRGLYSRQANLSNFLSTLGRLADSMHNVTDAIRQGDRSRPCLKQRHCCCSNVGKQVLRCLR
jgi:hypothetical protein